MVVCQNDACVRMLAFRVFVFKGSGERNYMKGVVPF